MSSCNHSNAVRWNPLRMAVECHSCGCVFFKAEQTDEGYVLKHINALNDESTELLSDLAGELFSAVRTTGEMTAVERPLFEKMARAAIDFLVLRAKVAREAR